MILINVFFAESNRAYDFRVDSDTAIEQLTADLVGDIAQMDHLTLSRNPGTFLLCRKKTSEIFSGSATLADYGVQSGDELLLV